MVSNILNKSVGEKGRDNMLTKNKNIKQITIEDLCNAKGNTIILGDAGPGKALLLKSMITEDIASGINIIVIDDYNDFEKTGKQLKCNICSTLKSINKETCKKSIILHNKRILLHSLNNTNGEKEVLFDLMKLSKIAMENGIKKIYVEEYSTLVFLKNLDIFKKFSDIEYMVVSEIYADELKGKITKEFFTNVVTAKIGKFNCLLLKQILKLKTSIPSVKFGEYNLIKLNAPEEIYTGKILRL